MKYKSSRLYLGSVVISALFDCKLEKEINKKKCNILFLIKKKTEGKGKFEKEVKHYRDSIMFYIVYNVTEEDLADLSSTSTTTSLSPASLFFNYTNDTSASTNSEFDFSFIDSNTTGKSSSNTSASPDTTTRAKTTQVDLALEIHKQKRARDKYYRIDEMLVDFRNLVIAIDDTNKFSGQDCVENSRWNFYSALLFTITIITTIGYGYIAPKTWEGQLVCICYATIGIPLTLICLANLSSSLGKMFIYIYNKFDSLNPITQYYRRKMKERRQRRRMRRQKKRERLLLKKQKSSLTAVTYLNATTSSNEGAVAGANEDESNAAMNDPDNDENNGRSRLRSNAITFIHSVSHNANQEGAEKEEDEEDEDDDDDDDDLDAEFLKTSKTNEVPIIVVLCVIFVYIYGGAYLFSR
jgi:hypothetical protein